MTGYDSSSMPDQATTIRIVQVKPIKTAAVELQTESGRLAETILRTLDEVYAYVRQASARKTGKNIVVYLDDAMTIQVGVELFEAIEPFGRVKLLATPGGRAATAAHFGEYSCLGETHNEIQRWCKAQGLDLAGPSWEIYGHWEDDPAKRRTDVFYLLA